MIVAAAVGGRAPVLLDRQEEIVGKLTSRVASHEGVRPSCALQHGDDGEAVVLRADGRSDFGALMTKRGGTQASLVAFDLLPLNGDDLRLRPIEARREALTRFDGIALNPVDMRDRSDSSADVDLGGVDLDLRATRGGPPRFDGLSRSGTATARY